VGRGQGVITFVHYLPQHGLLFVTVTNQCTQRIPQRVLTSSRQVDECQALGAGVASAQSATAWAAAAVVNGDANALAAAAGAGAACLPRGKNAPTTMAEWGLEAGAYTRQLFGSM
jgi:hypothetical protein